MAFLDNSGDIILDAVLTDTGRFRLAKGDGSFRITKFAFGDDEINYNSYNKNHSSGSAYYDLDILQTPVFEAFTNNTSTMKSKLISIARNNLLYLPVMKINEVFDKSVARHTSGSFMVAVDGDSETELNIDSNKGIILGQSSGGGTAGSYIRIDQGLDTTEIPPTQQLDADLVETQYILELDNRLGKIVDKTTGTPTPVSFIDDDNIATYYISLGTDINYVSEIPPVSNEQPSGAGGILSTIAGPRGTYLQFSIRASIELQTSTYLFTLLGGTVSDPTMPSLNSSDFYFIDSNIRVTGATTGYSIDIPVRFLKKQ